MKFYKVFPRVFFAFGTFYVDLRAFGAISGFKTLTAILNKGRIFALKDLLEAFQGDNDRKMVDISPETPKV